MVALTGFEPVTLRVWTVCSSQLSYKAIGSPHNEAKFILLYKIQIVNYYFFITFLQKNQYLFFAFFRFFLFRRSFFGFCFFLSKQEQLIDNVVKGDFKCA